MVSILPNAYAQAQAKLVPDQRGTKRPFEALEFEPGKCFPLGIAVRCCITGTNLGPLLGQLLPEVVLTALHPYSG